MKKIYFVRHGESEGNVGPVWQDSSFPLTEQGRKQAVFLSTRCAQLPVQAVISSTMNRAQETADIIVRKLKKPIEYSDLFAEARGPKELVGKEKTDPDGLRIIDILSENFGVSGFRFSDEENFEDLKERTGKALEYLSARLEEHILVVTHNNFMRILLARAMFDDTLTAEECVKYMRKFSMENSGLTILEYHEERQPSPWRLWVWNDHAHLAE